MEYPRPECEMLFTKCMNNKFFKLAGILITIALAGIGGPLLWGMDQNKRRDDKIAEIQVVKKDVEHVREAVGKIERKVEEINKKMINPEMFKLIMKQATKEAIKESKE